MTNPSPDAATGTLLKATHVCELWSPGDVSRLLSEGFQLAAVAAAPDDPDANYFRYSLIWTESVDKMTPWAKSAAGA